MFFGLWGPTVILLGYFVAAQMSNNREAWLTSLDVKGPLFYLYLAIGILHRLSTTYAVLGTSILKDEIRANPRKYLYIPLGIVIGCVLLAQGFVFHSVFSFMQTTHGQFWAFFLLAYVMILWERWHFCAQEYGVLSIYRAQANQFSPADKKFDRLYTVVLMLIVNMILFFWAGFSNERDILFYGTPLMTYEGALLDHLATGAFAVGMGLMLVAIFREWIRPDSSLPKTIFYLLIGGHTLLIYYCPEAFILFFFSYIIHHWMVAIGLFNRITMNSYRPIPWTSRLWKYCIHVGPIFAACVIWYYYFAAQDYAGNLPQPDTSLFANDSAVTKVLWGIVIGLFFAFNFLHYYYDRCFYSFRNPSIRKNVGPLLFGPTESK